MTKRKRDSIRERLARLLERKIPGIQVAPDDLNRHSPRDIRDGAASWSGYCRRDRGGRLHVYSFDSMTDCLRGGDAITTIRDDVSIEINAEIGKRVRR